MVLLFHDARILKVRSTEQSFLRSASVGAKHVPLAHSPLASYYSILTQTTSVKKQKNYNICKNSPLLNFGSNHVDFGGISMPASATANSSAMEVGYMEKATASFCCVSFT